MTKDRRSFSVRKRAWYNKTLTLRQLKSIVDGLVEKLPPTQDGHVVFTFETPRGVQELAISDETVTQSQIMDELLGEHYNRLSTQLTDAELHDSSAEVETTTLAQGEVLYLTAR